MEGLKRIEIGSFLTETGENVSDCYLTCEVAGQPLGKAPVVFVCHALTGNSSVAGPDGWWAKLIGKGQAIDTDACTILAFNIPGNGYDGTVLDNPCVFTLRDVARLFLKGLDALSVNRVEVLIGASMGGALAWQMAVLKPALAKYLIPIACDYRASDWLLAQTHLQWLLLEHSSHPLRDARIHGMLCYRTPESLNGRFKGQSDAHTGRPLICEWLDYHGRALEERFALAAYRTMTHLTATIGAAEFAEELRTITAKIAMVSIDSDLLFPHGRAVETYETLHECGADIELHTIHSIHGHDAFLMEYDQLSTIVTKILNQSN